MGLVLVMLLALAWSVQRAGWFDLLGFVIPVALYGAIAGALLGLTRFSVVMVLPVSAVLGTWVVLWTVGGEFFPDLDQVARLLVLRGDAFDWTRIVVDGGFAPQLSPYALGLGVLMWVTAFMAAYALYRHHRVLDCILLVGVALDRQHVGDIRRALRLPGALLGGGAPALAASRPHQSRGGLAHASRDRDARRAGPDHAQRRHLHRRQRRAGLDPDHRRGGGTADQRVGTTWTGSGPGCATSSRESSGASAAPTRASRAPPSAPRSASAAAGSAPTDRS